MKNRNKLIVFGFTAIVILATSCSTEKGLTIEKRHYRKGYSIAWHGKSKTEKMVASNQSESAYTINKMPSITVQAFTQQNEPQVALASNGSETTLKAIQTETKNRILSETVINIFFLGCHSIAVILLVFSLINFLINLPLIS